MDWSPFAVGGAAARSDSFTGLNPDFAEGVYRMVQDAHAAGIPLQITSAYRSPEVQARLYDAALKKYGSPAAARKWVAPPGRSQHNHGTAVDFAVNGSLIRDANSQEAQWIKANSAKYGLDVPMSWEPWQVEMAGARGQKPRETLSTNSPAVATAGLALTPSLIPGMDQEAPQMEPETAGGLLGMLFPDMGADRADQIRLGINGMLHNPNAGMQRSIEARMGERAQGRERQEQAAQAQQQANKTIAAMRQGGAPDYLIAAAEAGQVMPAFQEFLKLRAAQSQGQEPTKGVEINGQLVNPLTGEVIGDYRDTDQPDETYRQVTGEQAAAMGLDPAKVYNIGPDNKVTSIGGANTTIENNIGGEQPAGWKEIDKGFGQEWLTWVQGGGADATKQIGQLRGVVQALLAGEQLTGPAIGLQPDALQSIFNPEALDARQRVEEVVQRNLKAVLGAQFTQAEGDRLIARAFDQRLRPEQNAARLGALLQQMEAAANAKAAMVDYFGQNGTLQGFEGGVYVPSISDFESIFDQMDQQQGLTAEGSNGVPPPPSGFSKEEWLGLWENMSEADRRLFQ